VRGLEADKPLLRRLAKRLAANDADAVRLRAAVAREMGEEAPSGRTIWAALRSSPLVGLDWYVPREFTSVRDVDL
jgi:hypothetical protein